MPTPRIPRSLALVTAVEFTAGGAVLPFVSVYLRERGLDYGEVSAVLIGASCTGLVGPLLWGWIADRYVPIERLIAALHLAAAALLTWFSTAVHAPELAVAYALFYGVFHPTIALLNALSFHHLEDPRAQFGALRAWGSLGWMAPSLPIYLWLASGRQADFAQVIRLAAGLSVAMAAISLCLSPTAPPGREGRGGAGSRGYRSALRELVRQPGFVALLLTAFLESGAFAVFFYYSPTHLTERVHLERRWVGPIQCIAVAVEIPLFLSLRSCIRRWGLERVLALGCALLGARHVVFATATDVWLLSASYVLASGYVVFYLVGASLFIESLAAKEVRATAQTLLVLAGPGLGQIVGHGAAGLLAERAGGRLETVFVVAAIAAFTGCFIVLWRLPPAAASRGRAVR